MKTKNDAKKIFFFFIFQLTTNGKILVGDETKLCPAKIIENIDRYPINGQTISTEYLDI